MNNFRKYGDPPHTTVLVHGGPGAVGDMKPVAKELSDTVGVIESIHTAKSVNGQVEELDEAVEEASRPATLVGHSWGAWLVLIYTARFPERVKKLILIGSGPLERKYVPSIMETRLERLDEGEKERFYSFMRGLEDLKEDFDEFSQLMDKTDSYEPIEIEEETEFYPEVQRNVWREAAEMRDIGELLAEVKKIECPVLAIHGDHDPHPADGVKKPLSKAIDDFSFILLERCGHYPWRERYAREHFFEILKKEL